MPDQPVSQAEMEGRNIKAAKLADVIQAHDAGTAEARALPPLGWAMVARLAGVRPPSGKTVAVVLALLDHRERYASERAAGRARANPEFMAMIHDAIAESDSRPPQPTMTKEEFLTEAEWWIRDENCPGCKTAMAKSEGQRRPAGIFVCNDRKCVCCTTTRRLCCECGCIGVLRDEMP